MAETRGRKKGSPSRNSAGIVYKMMKERGFIPKGFYKADLMNLLTLVGEKVWDKVYEGHIVAIPGLFNMEIRPNTIKWARSVDWKRTLGLWQEDADAYQERLLVRARPTPYFLHVRHSTIGSKRAWWYYPLMLEIRPCKGKMKQIDDKYAL